VTLSVIQDRRRTFVLAWKETRVQDERARFVVEADSGEFALAELCRDYGISRKTGYKWLARFETEGVAGLADRSRAPRTQPRAVSEKIEQQIVELRTRHPNWGERTLKSWLQQHDDEQAWPAAATIGALLKRRGLTVPRKRRPRARPSAELSSVTAANQVWGIDFKGWFRTQDGSRCDPLTITDVHSHYLLRCQVVRQCDEAHVRPLLVAVFREHGLPERIRSDNGPPFATTGRGGLSRLAVWWIRLGILPERIQPGHPQQNGRHERMHRTLKQQTTRPAARNLRAQQKAFDEFRQEYNQERPHQGLGMATPGSLYEPSGREYPRRLPELAYPAGWILRRVTDSGEVKHQGRRFFLSEVLGGEVVGLEEIDEQHYRLWFGPVELGLLDRRQWQMQESARRGRRRR
jgi:transposase InsO family protein